MAEKHYNVEELTAGMIVAQALQDDKGRTIVQEGSRLTPMVIKRLGKWGISQVKIREEEAEAYEEGEASGSPSAKQLLTDATAEDKEFMRGVAIAVQKRFSSLPANELNDAFKKLTLKYLITEGRGAIPDL